MNFNLLNKIITIAIAGCLGLYAANRVYLFNIKKNDLPSTSRHIIILMGPPGSGKGSLSQWLVANKQWMQLSTGDLCRQHIADKTEIGIQINEYINAGKLIPDELMISMIEESMLKKFTENKVLILDGFPRTVTQAKALDTMLTSDIFNEIAVSVVELAVDDAVVRDRIMSRLICSNKACGLVYSTRDKNACKSMKCDKCESALIMRTDDTFGTLQKRLDIYHESASALREHYKNCGIVTINAGQSLEVVIDDFVTNVPV